MRKTISPTTIIVLIVFVALVLSTGFILKTALEKNRIERFYNTHPEADQIRKDFETNYRKLDLLKEKWDLKIDSIVNNKQN